MKKRYLIILAIVAIGMGMVIAQYMREVTDEQRVPMAVDTVMSDKQVMQNNTIQTTTAEEKSVLGASEDMVLTAEDADFQASALLVVDTEVEEIPAVPCANGDLGEVFMCLLNQYRIAENIEPLVVDPALSFVAEAHSSWMSAVGELSHIGEHGLTFVERCQQHAVTCSGENIAYGFRDAEHLLEMWQQSMLHDKNLRGPFRVAGIGISGGYATLLFEY